MTDPYRIAKIESAVGDQATYLEELRAALESHGSAIWAMRLAEMEEKVAPTLAFPTSAGRVPGSDPNANWVQSSFNALGEPQGLDAQVGAHPFAYMDGFDPSGTYTTPLTLAANGGSLAVPITITAPMLLRNVSIWNTDTVTARAWNWAVYKQPTTTGVASESTLIRVASGGLSEAFTPTVGSKRTMMNSLLVRDIPVAGGAKTPVQSSDGAYVYVPCQIGYVEVIRRVDLVKVATVAVTGKADSVVITPNDAYVYVGNSSVAGGGTTTVSVIRTSDNTVVATVNVGRGHHGLAVTPNGSFVYCSNLYDDTVSVIRTSDNTVVATVNVGAVPLKGAATLNSAYVYIPNNGGTVSVIRTSDHTVVATLTLSTQCMAAVLNPAGTYVYVANAGASNNVSVIRVSDNAVVATVAVGSGPGAITFLPNGSYAYVANVTGNTVSVIRTSDNTVVATVNVGNSPYGSAATPDGAYVHVANGGAGSVSVIRVSDNAVVQTIDCGGGLKNVFPPLVSKDGQAIFYPIYNVIPYTVRVSSNLTYLLPGVYWLVVQNTHATSTFGVGSAASGTLSVNRGQTKTLAVPLPATLDFVTPTWTKVTGVYAVILEGDVFGQAGSL